MTSTPGKKRSLGGALVSRLLHTYFLMTRGLTIGVRAIVRSDDGKFLLVRHTYTPGWHFPGGGVEKGESAERALSNELRQETGLRLIGKPRLHGVFHNCSVSKRGSRSGLSLRGWRGGARQTHQHGDRRSRLFRPR